MNKRRALLAALLPVALLASAAPLKIDAAKSTLSATFKQMNVPVEAPFKRFTAQIDYDPAKPQQAKAVVEIDTASLDLGSPDYNGEIAKKEWFNSAKFPKASFVSTSIAPGGAGKLTVNGKLTIKGKAADVAFPMTVKQQAGKQVFDGSLPIKRLTYAIGEGEWEDTGMVADEVLIKFHIVTQ